MRNLKRRDLIQWGAGAAGAAAMVAVPGVAASEAAPGAVRFACEIPIRHTVDVFVAGGGPSGLAAAVTAARQGRSVFLAEGHTCFGGMGTAARVPLFMPFTDGVNFLAGGFGREVYDRLFAAGGTGPGSRTTIKAEVLKCVYDDMIVEAKIGFAFATQAIAVEARDGRIDHVICAAKSGLFAVKAAMYIDCTGDGDLAAWGGAPAEKGDEQGRVMAGTLCSAWADIDWAAVNKAGLNAEAELAKAFADKVFTNEDRHLPGMWQTDTHVGGGNIGHTFGVDSTDERSLTQALLWGRKSLKEYEVFYKKYMKGFEKMTLVATGSLLGVRESRRIMGDYVLGLEDFKKRATFPDEIGRFSYPVDIHAPTASAKDYAAYAEAFKGLRYGKGENYGIPYRALVPKKLNNVLVAGLMHQHRPLHAKFRARDAGLLHHRAGGRHGGGTGGRKEHRHARREHSGTAAAAEEMRGVFARVRGLEPYPLRLLTPSIGTSTDFGSPRGLTARRATGHALANLRHFGFRLRLVDKFQPVGGARHWPGAEDRYGTRAGGFTNRAPDPFLFALPQAAPLPILGAMDEGGSKRVAFDVSADRQEMPIRLDGERLEPP
ncbi:MAG: FAD-dependent oxidoreductase, partial [Planctomycetota bacterium]|nr:FAD-dependent oxidoreductase [Planctomycetota bacterium]